MAVASLMSHGGHTLEEVMRVAKAKLRCVTFSSMNASDFDTSLGGDRSHDKFAKSTHCEPRDIDLFISHSWRDPPLEKWAALKSYCEKFRDLHHRDARLFVDMFCLDPDSASEPQYHPVYLMASNRLVVLKGPTFMTRLWYVT